VEETCKDFDVKYAEHPTFWSGIASHYRWLKQMGRLNGNNGAHGGDIARNAFS
jgi:linoleoyl-CoA desaturase